MFILIAHAASLNIIPNPSVENTGSDDQPDGWVKGGWGANDTKYDYRQTDSQDGTRSLGVQTTKFTDGDAKWYFTPQPVTAGYRYTYSDFYKATIPTKVVVQFDDGAGKYTYLTLGTAAAANNWNKFTYDFSVPATAKNATVFHLLPGVGTLQTDNFSLISNGPATDSNNGGNIIPNSSMETPNPNNKQKPYHWKTSNWGSNSTTFSYPEDNFWSSLFGGKSHSGKRDIRVEIKNYKTGDAKWYFDPVLVKPGSMYRYSDWYKSNVGTEIDAVFTMADGSTVYRMIGLPEATDGWKNFDTAFTVPTDAVRMSVYHLIRGNGTLTLDDGDLNPYQPLGFNRAIVSLTFDDGYDTAYTNVLPLLRKYGYKSTQYIVSGFIGKKHYMTLSQLKTLAKTQEIGDHSLDHKDMSTLSKSDYTNELTLSQSKLRQWTGQQVKTFAYPEGRYTSGSTDVAKQYFSGTRGVEWGLNSKDRLDPYDIKVHNITNKTTADQVAEWVNQAQATRTWLVLVYHAVDADQTNSFERGPYTVTPDQFDNQLTAIKDSGITVLPLSQALTETKSQQ